VRGRRAQQRRARARRAGTLRWSPVTGGERHGGGLVPPQLLVVAAATILQTGSAVATRLFPLVGAPGVLALRMGVGALLLVVLGRAWRHRPRGRALAAVLVFGAVLGAMNLLFYLALERIPLGATVALELVGPLAVAVAGSRRVRDLFWVALAAAGVVVLTNPATAGLDPWGVVLALGAGACWGGYVVVGSRVARSAPGTSGLAWAMAASCVVLVPLGIGTAGSALLSPVVLLAGVAVAVMSSVLPYSLELVAMRRVTPRGFGIMLSLQPAVATLAGLVVAGQRLSLGALGGIALVVAASLGAVPARRPRRRR
jgi:inner membrane transporter RhtA